MATYFNKYYFEFQDIHVTNPATWRVDIMDSQGEVPTEPHLLTPGAQPLITERVDTSEDKFITVVGRQITVSYVYTGHPSEPLPDDFFEADERRYRVEVRKNGVLDGVYFVKPDFSQYPDRHPPFVVQLKAIDGLGYSKGTLFNAYDENEKLYYQKISIYEALVTRALYKIFDEGTVINVMQSLVPNGSSPGDHLLTDSYIHTDIFYDFVSGPASVYDVIHAFCKNFNARLITEQNQIWFIRVQDLNYSSYTIDQYISESVVNTVSLPDFLRTAGPNAAFDSIPVQLAGEFIMLPAIKKANFEVEYKGINIIHNFLFDGYTGTDFPDWVRATANGTPPVGRAGTGTIRDPYVMDLPFTTADNHWINQGFFVGTPEIIVEAGEILDIAIKCKFNNTKSVRLVIYAQGEQSGEFVAFVLGSSGEWTRDLGVVDLDNNILITRSGKKREGSFSIRTAPLPRASINGVLFPSQMKLSISFFYPNESSDFSDGPIAPSVFIYPPKIGAISFASKGRHLTITNGANFSQVKEVEKFTFIDTGEDGVSNTIFTGPNQTPEDGGWESPKPGVTPGDIERQMAIGVIDQYQRSVNTWQGVLYSNSLAFYNVIQLSHRPDKVYMQSADRYNNRECTHDITLIEVFPEGTADIDEYIEYDIEDKEE